MSPWRILVAGDDPEAREPLAAALLADGYAVDVASSARDALELARQQDYAVSVVDFAANECEVLGQIRLLRPQCFLIALTAADSSLPAGKMDALEFAVKPCRAHDISLRVGHLIQLRSLQCENLALREQLAQQLEPANRPPVTISAGMRLREMEKVLIGATIQHTRGNIKEAASVLGIDRSTLYEKIKRYGIPRV